MPIVAGLLALVLAGWGPIAGPIGIAPGEIQGAGEAAGVAVVMVETAPETAPEAAPEALLEAVSEVTPEIQAEILPEAISEVVSEVVSVVKPEVSPEVPASEAPTVPPIGTPAARETGPTSQPENPPAFSVEAAPIEAASAESTPDRPQPEPPADRAPFQKSQPAAAAFLPAQAPAVFSLLVHPDPAPNPDRSPAPRFSPPWLLPRSSPPAPIVPSPQALHPYLQTLLSPLSPDYRREIAPWLGQEVTLAVTSFDRDQDPSNGQQPGYLVALEVANPDEAAQFLGTFWRRQRETGATVATSRVQGLEIREGKTVQGTIASAFVHPYFVLFANDRSVLAQALQTLQAPKLSLFRSPTYQNTLVNLPTTYPALAILNLAPFFPNLDTSPTLSLGLQPQDNALSLDLALAPSLGTVNVPPVPLSESSSDQQPVSSLFLPQNTTIGLSSSHLQHSSHQLQQVLHSLGLAPWAHPTPQITPPNPDPSAPTEPQPPLPNLSQTLGQTVGQMLDRFFPLALEPERIRPVLGDFVNAVRGEATIGLIPGPTEGWEGLAIVDRRNPSTAAALSKLDPQIQAQGLDVDRVQLGDRSVTAWTQLATESSTPPPNSDTPAIRLNLQVAGVHATVPPYEVFATSLETLARSLQSWDQAQSDPSSAQARPNTLSLQWPSFSSFLEPRFPLLPLLRWTVPPLFHHLESITLTPELPTPDTAPTPQPSTEPPPQAKTPIDRGTITLRWQP